MQTDATVQKTDKTLFSMKLRNVIGLSLIGFGVGTYWQVENFWINLYIVRNIHPDALNVSYMVSVSAIVGILTHIIIGALSDASKSPFGRRKIYILWGGIFGAIAMSLFPLIQNVNLRYGLGAAVFFGVFIDAFITFFGDMTTPTRNALFKEHSIRQERGKLNLIIMVFQGVGAGIIQLLYMFGFDKDDYYFYIGSVCILIGAIGCVLVVEDRPRPNNPVLFKECIKEITKRESYEKNKPYYHLLIVMALVSFGINIFSNFIALYIEKGLGYEQESVGAIMLIISIFSVGGFLFPAFSDKYGRKPITLILLVWGGILLICVTFNTHIPIVPLGILLGVALGGAFGASGTITNWLQDACPEENVGSLLAYQMVATVLPMAPGSLVGGLIADNLATGSQLYSPYFFLVAGIVLLVTVIPTFFIQDTIKRRIIA